MGPEVPWPAKKVFLKGFSTHLHTLLPPINFSAPVAVLQNNVTDRFIDNHIFSECQELSSFLKVAQPFDTFKFFVVKSYNFRNGQKNRGTFWAWHFNGVS